MLCTVYKDLQQFITIVVELVRNLRAHGKGSEVETGEWSG
jgi:hypothetical protein